MTYATNIPELIKEYQARSRASDTDLAAALGYTSPAVISLVKEQKMDFPINKVAALAEAIEIDAGVVLRAALASKSPDLLAALEAALPTLTWTRDEVKLIDTLRKLKGARRVAPVVFDGSSVVALLAL